MSIDIFGRRLAGDRVREGARGPPGIGFKTTADNQYDVGGKRLCNIANSQQPNDAVNLKTARELIQRAMDTNRGVLQKSIEDREKKYKENIKQQRAVSQGIYNSLVHTSEFLNSLDVRLSQLEHTSTHVKNDSAQPENRMQMRVENAQLINQLGVMLHGEGETS